MPISFNRLDSTLSEFDPAEKSLGTDDATCGGRRQSIKFVVIGLTIGIALASALGIGLTILAPTPGKKRNARHFF